jgi:hypothetical protein
MRLFACGMHDSCVIPALSVHRIGVIAKRQARSSCSTKTDVFAHTTRAKGCPPFETRRRLIFTLNPGTGCVLSHRHCRGLQQNAPVRARPRYPERFVSDADCGSAIAFWLWVQLSPETRFLSTRVCMSSGYLCAGAGAVEFL